MNLLPIAQTLEEAGVGVMAETIFINMIPIDCQEGVLLRNKLSGTYIDYELPGYYKTRFQVIVRTKSVPVGEERMAQVFDALTLCEAQVTDMYIRYLRPVTMPITFPLSKGNLLEISADFEIVFMQNGI